VSVSAGSRAGGCPSPEATPKLLLHHGGSYFIPFWVRGQLLAFTNSAAPNFRIIHINLDDPSPKSWRDVVPESDRRIKDFAVAANRIFVTRVDHFSTKIEVFDLDNGDQKTDIPLPPHGSARLIDFTHGADEAFYSYTSITQPPVVYRYDTKNEKVELWEKMAHFSAQAAIAVEQVSYLSNDGTEVPMLLAAREDLIHSGPLPTFLTGYGGFGSCVTPRFTAHASFLLEHGLLLAVPAVRGGSELGEQWHLAGRREKRQNCFDDFVAAAEWLITEGRSESGRIAIGGGSNAGLLVGAVITQRPDLFRAAICIGPLLDMIRYHLFDFAAGWADEYGSPEDPADFSSLSSYSPYHNAINNKSYPAVLFVSGDADTRCNPMHARKMVARLQAASTSGYPILLDYKEEWGHMPVQPLSTKIEGLVDRLTFLCHELQVELHSRRLS